MEPIHIFYKELPVDENNIFTANIAEKNEVENVKFNKSFEYAVIINQKIGSDSKLVTITDVYKLNEISNNIQKFSYENFQKT